MISGDYQTAKRMGHKHITVRLSCGVRWFLEVGPPSAGHISPGEFIPLMPPDELFSHFVPRQELRAGRRDVLRAFFRDDSVSNVRLRRTHAQFSSRTISRMSRMSFSCSA